MDSAEMPEVTKPAPRASSGGGFLAKPIQFLKDVRLELKKVSWPTRGKL